MQLPILNAAFMVFLALTVYVSRRCRRAGLADLADALKTLYEDIKQRGRN